MREYLEILKTSGLFRGMKEEEILSILDCLGAEEGSFGKGEYLFRQGDEIHSIAVLLSGKVRIESTDFWGERHILGGSCSG